MFESVSILGVNVSVINIETALTVVDKWIDEGESQFVCFRDVHGVMAAQKDDALRKAHDKAGMIAPDGMPLVWTGRAWGHDRIDRVCGPDFMLESCKHSVSRGYKHFLYGGAPGVAEKLGEVLREKFPGVQIAGTHCPPFRDLSAEEDEASVQMITESGANLVWVGLGSPKQEKWMADHVGRIDGAILFGVGAAFDFHAGIVKRAPRWMRKSGLEWLYRLASEPRRLWRRYVVMAPKFLFRILLQSIGNKK